MLSAWRIVKEKYATTAFSGEGAAKFGGRWNSPGVSMVYTSGSQALAALELLVHLNPPFLFKYKAFEIQFDEGLVCRSRLDDLPADWTHEPPPRSTAVLGDRWAENSKSAIFAVPSMIVPVESNYLLNPLHPDFPRIKVGEPRDFAFDSRLL